MKIKGLLFDKDGTLIEFNGIFGGTYLRMLQQHFGHSESEALEMLMRTGYDPVTGGCKGGSPMASETLSQIVRHWWPEMEENERQRRRKFIDDNFDKEVNQKATPIANFVPVFGALRAKGYVLGVATNDTEGTARSHMTQLDLHDHFITIIGADSVPVPKPSGNMVKLFAQVSGLEAREIAMIGDNAHDINEARAGGAGLAIGVLSGNSAHEDLAHIADHVIADVADLPQLLETLG